MKTLTVEAEIAPDGMLHVHVPSGLPPGRVEVVLVLQPKSNGLRSGKDESLKVKDASQVQPQATTETALPPATNHLPMSEREKFERLAELMEEALAGVTWAEIEEGRRDRDFGG
jgi:hypothetical protein